MRLTPEERARKRVEGARAVLAKPSPSRYAEHIWPTPEAYRERIASRALYFSRADGFDLDTPLGLEAAVLTAVIVSPNGGGLPIPDLTADEVRAGAPTVVEVKRLSKVKEGRTAW